MIREFKLYASDKSWTSIEFDKSIHCGNPDLHTSICVCMSQSCVKALVQELEMSSAKGKSGIQKEHTYAARYWYINPHRGLSVCVYLSAHVRECASSFMPVCGSVFVYIPQYLVSMGMCAM